MPQKREIPIQKPRSTRAVESGYGVPHTVHRDPGKKLLYVPLALPARKLQQCDGPRGLSWPVYIWTGPCRGYSQSCMTLGINPKP